MIPESTLLEIQSKINIVDVVSAYIPLKAAGRNFKTLCPFHSEKTPSFMVNPERQIFHCFGCGAGGNIFGFIMKMENISFPQAAELLAEKTGVEIVSLHEGDSQSLKKRLYETLEKTAQFFCDSLLNEEDAAQARQYLRGRGLKLRDLKTFRLGFCCANEARVLTALKEMGLDESHLEKTGVLGEGQGPGRLRFRGRIMFPICDIQGRVVGFGARAMGDRQPKYLNSPETALFSKSNLLYGLHLAKKAMLDAAQAILVEGYLDVISVFSRGIENVVASLGTAFNATHVRLLRRYAQEVVVAYDGDDAGSEASLRALEVFLDEGVVVRIARLPQGHDPDSMIRGLGKESFEQLIRQSPSMVDYRLDILMERHGSSGEKGKVRIVREMTPMILRLANPILQDHCLKQASQRLGISEGALRGEIGRSGNKLGPRRGKSPEPLESVIHESPAFLIEDEILRLLLLRPELVEKYRSTLNPETFESEPHKFLLSHILDPSARIENPAGSPAGNLQSRLLVETLGYKDPEADLKRFMNEHRRACLKRRCVELTSSLKQIDKFGDTSSRRNAILSELQNILKEIDLLRRL